VLDGVVASTEGIVVAIDGCDEGGAERDFQLILERNHECTTGFIFWCVLEDDHGLVCLSTAVS